jgi:hypothetical protein
MTNRVRKLRIPNHCRRRDEEERGKGDKEKKEEVRHRM